jgi:hypothetical protein
VGWLAPIPTYRGAATHIKGPPHIVSHLRTTNADPDLHHSWADSRCVPNTW